MPETLPVGAEWSYEVRWDGYRALLLSDGNRAALDLRQIEAILALKAENWLD